MSTERRFLLNDRVCDLLSGDRGLVLDWLRRRRGLVGTKEGCGEGECGACTVLLGEPDSSAADQHAHEPDGAPLRYRAVCSCLLDLGELPGRHLVTIEGLNPPVGLNPIQQALVDAGAPQCGFCFPGIVVSLTGFFLGSADLSRRDAVAALDGNICRCSGYASILRAIDELCGSFAPRLDASQERVAQLAAWGIVPEYFATSAAHLSRCSADAQLEAPRPARSGTEAPVLLAGGTDLFIQQPELPHRCEHHAPVVRLSRRRELAAIHRSGDRLIIGGGVTIEDLKHDQTFCDLVPAAPEALDRFASTIIRNRATVAGNLVNASPIGDVAVLLLALDADVVLKSGAALDGAGSSGPERAVALRDFFLGYKQLAMQPGEVLTAVRIPLGVGNDRVSFEKISQRRFLDIASVNSAARFALQQDGTITSVNLAFGGVAPVPLLARKTMALLAGRRLDAAAVREAVGVLLGEIAPIDDVRGSADYKRELARRVFFAHALRVAPERVRFEDLL